MNEIIINALLKKNFLNKRNRPVLSKSEYKEYIESKEWREKSNTIKLMYGNLCAFCQYPGKLDVHHITYDRLGCEFPDDLIALCETCHKKQHGIMT
jgi:5-methylcytosine-specific restriction endonuclease McrA